MQCARDEIIRCTLLDDTRPSNDEQWALRRAEPREERIVKWVLRHRGDSGIHRGLVKDGVYGFLRGFYASVVAGTCE